MPLVNISDMLHHAYRRYVAETGVDFLAVSIGTVHGRTQGEPQLDFQRLADIDHVLSDVPLVIHGGTGLSEAQFRRLIENRVAKINLMRQGSLA